MGVYLNPGNELFYTAINSEIYVDKSNLIRYTNRVVQTLQKYICNSRPRRFGKSITAAMLAAYYSRGCNSGELFSSLAIARDPHFSKYLNQYNVIFLNMQEFLSQSSSMQEMLDLIKKSVLWELLAAYPDYSYFNRQNLTRTMMDLYQNCRTPFVVIIDEWDCVFREYQNDRNAQERYLDFLRDLLKDKAYIHLVYMTGILPIKKYGTHSALNMFDEFSMLSPGPLAEFTGFTEDEVFSLCARYNMNPEEVKNWYDGYGPEGAPSIYSPRSVVSCLLFGELGNYWNQTETFEALQMYIDLNFDGLKDDVLAMIAGESIPVNTSSFTNDMNTFRTEDDVLTLLVHLGYLAYDARHKTVRIPNNEVRNEYANAVSVSNWGEISKALKHSSDTLMAIWQKRPEQVAKAIEQAHFETSHLQYNDENALSYTISLALYAARNFYTVIREFPTGKGFADLVFLPRKDFPEKPALLVELKWDKSADSAIAQIYKKQYAHSLRDYHGNLLLVGINYDKATRTHSCKIEEWNA